MTGRPSVGRIVHYVSYGTPGGEYTSQCRAAVVTDLANSEEPDGDVVGLAVLNPTGMFFNRAAHHDGAEKPGREDCPTASDHGDPLRYCGCGWAEASYRGGTWHWPERVD